MNHFLTKYYRLIFYACWLLLAMVQSFATELIDDEAYYWAYSKFLAWGYFDHPPMIALLIKCGYALFQNELGVRLFPIILNLATLVLIESLIERKNFTLFVLIAVGVGFLQTAGILAVPDTPLLFFSALYFYCYKKFVANTSWQTTFRLGFVTALLFYSKYHGILIVVFTILSNLKLLRYKYIWFSFFCALLIYSPHLFWQWENNWLSFRYHLFESNVNAYKISYTTDYILGQLLLAGPLMGFVLLPFSFLYNPKTALERALKFSMVGFYLFFLLSSFRGRVETNWTLPVLISLIVLSHQFIVDRVRFVKAIKILAVTSLIIIAFVRIYLIVDIGFDNLIKKRFHHNKSWAKAIASKTGDIPVVFKNSYQRASLFWFYSGKPSHSLNSYKERRNNYNLWPIENKLLGQPVFIADIYEIQFYPDSIKTKKGSVGIQFDSSFSSFEKVKITLREKKLELNKFDSLNLNYHISVPEFLRTFVLNRPEIKTELLIGIFKGRDLVQEFKTNISLPNLLLNHPTISLPINNLPAGKYFIRFSIQSKNYPPTHNSEKTELIIRD